MEKDMGNVSDGYHTFDELYEHRHMLFMCFARATQLQSWKSKVHSDGSVMEGWFVGGINLPEGAITYHLPIKYYELFTGKNMERAPHYDGHTANDVLKRMESFLER